MLTEHPVPIHIKAIIGEHYAFRPGLYMCVINKFLFYLSSTFMNAIWRARLYSWMRKQRVE